MDSKISLPTDNIYKFYALFGLVLLIFGLSATLYTVKSTNDFMARAYVDLEELKAQATLSARDQMKKALLERQIEVAKGDKQFLLNGAAVTAVVGVLAMVLGFGRWHFVIQPALDEMSELQLQKLRRCVQPSSA